MRGRGQQLLNLWGLPPPARALAAPARVFPSSPAADDLGHADLEWMSTPVGQIKTPNLKELRDRGIQLTNYHVMMVCSPSRASLMTGRYPIRYGMQH